MLMDRRAERNIPASRRLERLFPESYVTRSLASCLIISHVVLAYLRFYSNFE